jgi:hypothetical protein
MPKVFKYDSIDVLLQVLQRGMKGNDGMYYHTVTVSICIYFVHRHTHTYNSVITKTCSYIRVVYLDVPLTILSRLTYVFTVLVETHVLKTSIITNTCKYTIIKQL